jgi:hypothetical protein
MTKFRKRGTPEEKSGQAPQYRTPSDIPKSGKSRF